MKLGNVERRYYPNGIKKQITRYLLITGNFVLKKKEKKMTKTEQFLNLYKTYESLLREHGKDYKEIEESSDDKTLNRMRMNRQMRNYLSHNPDPGFLMVTDIQIKMLEHLIKEEQQSGDIIKKHLITPKQGTCQIGDLVKNILSKMIKQKWTNMIVLDEEKHILGTISIYKLTNLIIDNLDAILSKKSYGQFGKNFICVAPNMLVEDIQRNAYDPEHNIICCTADGEVSGTCIGIWKK